MNTNQSNSSAWSRCLRVMLVLLACALVAPGKDKGGEKSAKQAAQVAADGTAFSMAGSTLTVRKKGQTLKIKGVFVSTRATTEYSILPLYNPSSGFFAVPMEDTTYHLYDLSDRFDSSSFKLILTGGRPLAFGKWGLGREYWRFTGWKDEKTLISEILPLEEPGKGSTIDVDVDKEQIKGADSNEFFRLRRRLPDEDIEQDFSYGD